MAELVPFAELRLQGGRFEAGAGMPLDALPELSAYRVLVIEAARTIYREHHPERRRVPKGFVDHLELRLRRVDEGSQVPVIERLTQGDQLPLSDEFDEARDRIAELIADAQSASPPPPWAEGRVLDAVSRFGRSLQPTGAD